MKIKLLTEHRSEFLSLTGDCTGSSESTLVKMPHCWKSHVTALTNVVPVENVLPIILRYMREYILERNLINVNCVKSVLLQREICSRS